MHGNVMYSAPAVVPGHSSDAACLPLLQIIANDQGNRITPSYVAFTPEERLIGDAAKNQATINPLNTVYDVKRLIGRSFSDKEVQRDKKLVSYAIVDKGGKPNVQVDLSGEKKVCMWLLFFRAVEDSYVCAI